MFRTLRSACYPSQFCRPMWEEGSHPSFLRDLCSRTPKGILCMLSGLHSPSDPAPSSYAVIATSVIISPSSQLALSALASHPLFFHLLVKYLQLGCLQKEQGPNNSVTSPWIHSSAPPQTHSPWYLVKREATQPEPTRLSPWNSSELQVGGSVLWDGQG